MRGIIAYLLQHPSDSPIGVSIVLPLV